MDYRSPDVRNAVSIAFRQRRKNRWRRGLAVSLAAVIALLITSRGWAALTAAKSVTFAYNTPTLSGTLPIVVAQDFGFFAAEGLDVKTVFIRGGPTAMAALVGGGVDYIFVAGVAAVCTRQRTAYRLAPSSESNSCCTAGSAASASARSSGTVIVADPA